MILPILISGVILLLSLLKNASASQPTLPGKSARSDSLVELVKLDSTIKLDIRYATAKNFMRRPIYSQARAFLQLPAAQALVRIHRKLRRQGFGLLIFDGYRPWSVTKKFWDETPPEKRTFVANPAEGSRHNRGCAVDLSLYELKSGREIIMPSAYDDFSEKASPTFKGGSSRQRMFRDLLRRAMESEGFTVNSGEWWHFDYQEWKEFGILDVPFELLK